MTFLLVALVEGGVNGLLPLYYRTRDWTGAATDYWYKPYDTATGSTSFNWWWLASIIKQWGFLSIFGVAFLTQLIAIFGGLQGFNVAIWTWLVGVGGSLIAATYLLLMGLAYDTVSTKCREGTADACTV